MVQFHVAGQLDTRPGNAHLHAPKEVLSNLRGQIHSQTLPTFSQLTEQ
jgi:hypothetical protein